MGITPEKVNIKKIKKISVEEARKRKFLVDWNEHRLLKPNFTGTKVFDNYSVEELVDYIDWSPFFHAWELRGKYPSILSSEKYGVEANKIFSDGKEMLNRIIRKNILNPKLHQIIYFPIFSNISQINLKY